MKNDREEMEPYLQYWAKMPGWTIKEQAALLLELDPAQIIPANRKQEFTRKKRILKRAQQMRLLRAPTPPIKFIMWVDQNPLIGGFPPSLREEVEKNRSLRWIGIDNTTRKAKSQGPKNSQWTRNKSYKTIMSALLVMAMEKYQYRPGVRGPASGTINKAMKLKLIEAPTQQTIAKTLDRAWQVVGSDLKRS